MTTYPMSPGDAAWFRMDSPANPAIMTGLLITGRALDFDRVRAVYRKRLMGFKRFRQRVVELGLPDATPLWQDLLNFDIDQHLHHIALAAPNDQSALCTLVSDIASTPLDHSRPLWQVYVVDEVEQGSALIMRVHQCLADATAMMTVIGTLFDIEAADFPAPEGLLAPALNKTADPPSPLKGAFGLHKRVAWSTPVPIQDIKAIGARSGAKVNDVLVAAMTGALRSYLKGRDVDVNHTTLRAMVPVDLRPPDRMGQLGNECGLALLELAVASAGPVQRLAITKARMDALKRSPEPLATLMLMEILGHVPKALEDFSNPLFDGKANLVMSNAVGPREVLSLAGAPIDRMISWAPHPGHELGMSITTLSYRGFATLSVIGDVRLVPDPHMITHQFHREFQAMLRTVKAASSRAPARKVTARKTAH